MAGQFAHQFDFQISPARRTTFDRAPDQGTLCKSFVLDEKCHVEGWLLPAENGTTHGLRAVCGDIKVVARRKQLRPDIYFHHQQHPEALKSGFKMDLPVKVGRSAWVLEFKDSQGKWQAFCALQVTLPPLWKWLGKWLKPEAVSEYEAWVSKQQKENAESLLKRLAAVEQLTEKPLFSVLMPVYNTPEKWLKRVIQSVTDQAYTHWELCIANDCSTQPHVDRVLQDAARRDPRVKVVNLPVNGHICRASNAALDICTGDYTVLLDHDDELPPHALLRVAEEIVAHPEANLIFSDEDKINEQGVCSDPYFKPGINLELLHSFNYICHLSVMRAHVLKNIGGFRPGYEGAQDWDLFLRFTSQIPLNTVRHIPEILYHWRTLESSTASQSDAKPYAREAGMRAVQDYLKQNQPAASLITDETTNVSRIAWPLPSPAPKVSIIIPTRDRLDLLQIAVESLFGKTSYPDYELIIVDHASAEQETLAYLNRLKATGKAIIVRAEGEFNWSRLNNIGVKSSTGEILLFLNNDIEIIQADWLEELVRNVCRDGIGAVGARLHYPNGSIQHAGVALRLLGMAGHPFQALDPTGWTLAGSPSDPREVTAVTGACLAVKRTIFDEAGGFDEVNLPISYNDVDFCLRLRSLGYQNLYAANAVLVHHESASRHTLEKESVRKAAATAEAQIMLARWPNEFAGDAFYNPNLSLLTTLPSLPKASDN